MKRTATALLTAALVLAACGGESEDDRVAAAISASLLEDPTFADYEITEDEADCVADGVTADIGTDRLTEVGALDDETEVDFTELSDDEIGAIGDAMDVCIDDIRAVLVDAVAEGILENPDPSFPVADDEAICVAEAVTDEIGLSRLIIIGVEGERTGGDQFEDLQPAEIEVFSRAFTDCIDVRAILLDSIAASGAPPDIIACLDENISDADIAALFEAGFSGIDSDTAAEAALSPAVEACT